jgi:hypothetical protein
VPGSTRSPVTFGTNRVEPQGTCIVIQIGALLLLGALYELAE